MKNCEINHSQYRMRNYKVCPFCEDRLDHVKGEAKSTQELLERYDKARSRTYRSLAECYRESGRSLYPWQFVERAKANGAARVLQKMAYEWGKEKG